MLTRYQAGYTFQLLAKVCCKDAKTFNKVLLACSRSRESVVY